MGAHRKQNSRKSLANNPLPSKLPPYPNNIGKIRRIKAIDGTPLQFKIEDEIIRPQRENNQKIIVFQKIIFLNDNRVEYRWGYYMIGVKPKTKGRWVWGQFCLMIPQDDLLNIIAEAQKRKWF